MREQPSPFRFALVLVSTLAVRFLAGAVPSFAAGTVKIDVGPLLGELTLPPGWEVAGQDLAAKLLKRDGVEEPPALSLLMQQDVVYATTKLIEGMTLTAADLVGGGSELAKALGIDPSKVHCEVAQFAGGLDLSICQTSATSAKLSPSGKARPTAAIWVDIPLSYEDQGRVANSWTSIYFRGPAKEMGAGGAMVQALLDALRLKPGLRAVPAGSPALQAGRGTTPEGAATASPPTAAPAPASDGGRLAEILAEGLADKPTPRSLLALREVAESYSGTVLGEAAGQLAREAGAKLALATWEALLAKTPGDARLRSLALRFFGAALRTADGETMKATAGWLAGRQLNLPELQPQDLALVFPGGDLCAASGPELPKSVRDLGALEGAKSGSGRRIIDLLRGRGGLALPEVSAVAVAGADGVWRPKGDRNAALPPVLVMDGRLGTLLRKDAARVREGYEFRPFANLFEALDRLCPAAR